MPEHVRVRLETDLCFHALAPRYQDSGDLVCVRTEEMSEATQRSGQRLHIANVSNEDEINTAMAGGDAHRCLSQCWIARRHGGPN
jgi:hypothetical protein